MSAVQLLKSKKRALFRSRLKHLGPKTSFVSSNHSSLTKCLLSLNIWSENQTIASYRAMKGEVSPALFEQKCHRNPRFVFPQLRDISKKPINTKPPSLKSHLETKMVFVPPKGKWALGPFADCYQPVNQKLKPVWDIDIFLVPGLAFDREGRRLGRGAGHYDRFLAQSGTGQAGSVGQAESAPRTLPAPRVLPFKKAEPASQGGAMEGFSTSKENKTQEFSNKLSLKIGLAHHFQICNEALPEESHDIRMDVVVTERYFFVPICKNGHKNRALFNKWLI